MAKQHATTLKFESYSMGGLANVIWGVDWDVEYFVDNSTKMSFGKLIHDMYNPNPEAQIIVQHIMCTSMGIHTIGLHPKNVIESNCRHFVIAKYGIWCNLHNL
jgi:hypothetical protein